MYIYIMHAYIYIHTTYIHTYVYVMYVRTYIKCQNDGFVFALHLCKISKNQYSIMYLGFSITYNNQS